MRYAGIFLRPQTAMILLGAGALGSVAAEEARPAKPPMEEPAGSAATLRSIHDLLWLSKITDRHNLDIGLRHLLEALDKSKVPTAEKAEEVALGAKLKAGGGAGGGGGPGRASAGEAWPVTSPPERSGR